MSLRWRQDGRLLCGAKSELEEGDCYIDDRLHYQLSVVCEAVKPHDDESETGLWDFVKVDEAVKKLSLDEIAKIKGYHALAILNPPTIRPGFGPVPEDFE